MKCNAGGKRIEIEFETMNSPAARLLADELKAYAQLPEQAEVDIRITYTETPESLTEVSRNPSEHIEDPYGYVAVHPHSTIAFRLVEGKPFVRFHYKDVQTNYRHKLRGMQFTHPWEEVGQIFHEAVLAPSLMHYFSREIALIHGSSLVDNHGRGVLFGGSGGVGKTTLELELIHNKEFKFLADDISILDSNGMLHPNYNHPKIYAYNVLGRPDLQRKLFSGKSMLDKAWWSVQALRKPPHAFRRRAHIGKFYGSMISQSSSLARIFLLFRITGKSLRVRPIEPALMAAMNLEIIRTEFPMFVKHLSWHRYNRTLLNVSHHSTYPFDFDQIMTNMGGIQAKVFQNTLDCAVVEIPSDYNAMELSGAIADLVDL